MIDDLRWLKEDTSAVFSHGFSRIRIMIRENPCLLYYYPISLPQETMAFSAGIQIRSRDIAMPVNPKNASVRGVRNIHINGCEYAIVVQETVAS